LRRNADHDRAGCRQRGRPPPRRTFAIIAHPDAGKTTLTEKLLLFGGAIQLAGEVKAKKRPHPDTRSDWMKIERERGISVVTSVMTFEYGGNVFNLLDTPGHEDFSDDTYRTLSAVDSAGHGDRRRQGHRAAHAEAVRGLPHARHPDRHLHQQDGPRGARHRSKFLDEIEQKLALDTAPMTWPIGQGKTFAGTYHLYAERGAPRRRRAERTKVNGAGLRHASPACCRRTSLRR
jgi:peptide chain release factor 3